jgi:error-prone DNA polymerase
MSAYAELAVTTNFSFLRGASQPEELVEQAKAIGLAALGVADRNSVAGVVRAHTKAKETGLKLIIGARLVFADGTPDILAYPQDRPAWGRLTRLLSLGKLRAEKGDCILGLPDLLEFLEGFSLIVMPPGRIQAEALAALLMRLKNAAAPRSVWLAAGMLYRGDDKRRLARLATIAGEAAVPLIAVNDVLYHVPERRALQDVVTCIREHVTLDAAGFMLEANAERHLKSPDEMTRLFRAAPEAIGETLYFIERCRFSLDELHYEYPDETRAGYATPQEALVALTEEGARRRYPNGVDLKIRHALDHELALIGELKYAPYFLTVHDIVRFARSQGILCQGRGSAANSVICYCLGITEVDPQKIDLLFERFVSAERQEPPDIDVDFEHERREEVIQYIYKTYGRERAGLAATVICYRGRSAVREVGKVFGLSDDTVGALAGSLWGWSSEGVADKEARRVGLDPADPRLALVLELTRQLINFPRHLSQHVGGFVITRSRLDEVVPIENAAMEERTVVEWDKDDLNDLGILKIDVLGLGMLSCIRRSLDFLLTCYSDELSKNGTLPLPPPLRGRSARIARREGGISDRVEPASTPLPNPPPQGGRELEQRAGQEFCLQQTELHLDDFGISQIPAEDPAVYRMLSRADSIGVFQVESRAQMSMLPRLKPKEFYDLVIEVAIVRPGPIQGDMVHPYLRRREKREPVTYESPELEAVLRKTLGVPLFQEQAMRIAIVAAGFTPAEADRLRRAMATFKRVGTISTFQRKMIDGMIAKGYRREFAERCFQQIEGFGEYGFPESHAASFALLVYASAWIKCHYPDVFAAALLNSQPMGFYAPAQIVRDAEEHGIEVRPLDVNFSDWDCTLERTSAAGGLHPRHLDMKDDIWSKHALRLGLRQISGLAEKEGCAIADARRLARSAPSPLVGEGWGGGSSPARREVKFDSVRDLWLRTRLPPATLERLAAADAFGSLGLNRRDALWAVKALRRAGDKDDLPLFAHAAMAEQEPDADLPPMPPGEEVIEDYRHLRLSLKAHPVAFLRSELDRRGVVAHQQLASLRSGERVTVAGLVLVRQRPGTTNVIFMTLEDETGVANTIVWPRIFETYRPVVLGARLISVTGELQNESGVIHVVARRMEDLSPLLRRLSEAGTTIDASVRCDETKRPVSEKRLPVNHRKLRRAAEQASLLQDLPPAADARAVMPKGRNFH